MSPVTLDPKPYKGWGWMNEERINKCQKRAVTGKYIIDNVDTCRESAVPCPAVSVALNTSSPVGHAMLVQTSQELFSLHLFKCDMNKSHQRHFSFKPILISCCVVLQSIISTKEKCIVKQQLTTTSKLVASVLRVRVTIYVEINVMQGMDGWITQTVNYIIVCNC